MIFPFKPPWWWLMWLWIYDYGAHGDDHSSELIELCDIKWVMRVKQCHKPSSNFTINRWYGYHSQSWVVKMALFYPHFVYDCDLPIFERSEQDQRNLPTLGWDPADTKCPTGCSEVALINLWGCQSSGDPTDFVVPQPQTQFLFSLGG